MEVFTWFCSTCLTSNLGSSLDLGVEEEMFAMGLAEKQAKRNVTRKKVTLIMSSEEVISVSVVQDQYQNGDNVYRQSVHKSVGNP